jgi:hypothetical protein
LHDHVAVKFKKLVVAVNKNAQKVYVCKEDKESLTKSKMNLITQFFKYLLSLDDSALGRHVKHLETTSFKLMDFAIQILLVPMIH